MINGNLSDEDIVMSRALPQGDGITAQAGFCLDLSREQALFFVLISPQVSPQTIPKGPVSQKLLAE